METLGHHIIAELDACDAAELSDPEGLRHHLVDAVEAAGATRLTDVVYEFGNGGVSGFVLLAESHISIHTWPEHGYAAVDIYTCGRHTRPEVACRYLAKQLGAGRLRMSVLERGRAARDGGHEHVRLTTAQGSESELARWNGGLRADEGHKHRPVGLPKRSTSNPGL